MKVLFIDDERSIGRLARRVLGRHGHEVVLAQDGEQAWAVFSEDPESYDVIIADVVMPELSGTELVERLRFAGHQVPCVLMSGHHEAERFDEDVQLLCKPFKITRLAEILDELGS